MTGKIPPDSPRVLVVRVGALGDTLMATPVVRALRAARPERCVDFLCWETSKPLLETNPLISRLFALRHRNLPLELSWEKRQLVRRLRACDFECAILLEASPRYHNLLKAAGILHIRSFEQYPFDPLQHCAANYLRVAGFEHPEPGALASDLFLSNEDRHHAARLLAGLPRPWIGIHAGYGPRHRKKSQSLRLRGWPAENFAQVARALGREGASVLLTGSDADLSEARLIASRSESPQVRVLAGQTGVRELAALVAQLDLFISVDSGPAHMAAAVGTPLIVLWGPGIYEQTRPIAGRAPVAVLRRFVPCSPCYGHPLMKTCRDNICMQLISPAEVLDEANRLLIGNRHRFDSQIAVNKY